MARDHASFRVGAFFLFRTSTLVRGRGFPSSIRAQSPHLEGPHDEEKMKSLRDGSTRGSAMCVGKKTRTASYAKPVPSSRNASNISASRYLLPREQDDFYHFFLSANAQSSTQKTKAFEGCVRLSTTSFPEWKIAERSLHS